jgi:hypothetical protein
MKRINLSIPEILFTSDFLFYLSTLWHATLHFWEGHRHLSRLWERQENRALPSSTDASILGLPLASRTSQFRYPTKGRRPGLPLHPPSGYGIRLVVEERFWELYQYLLLNLVV